MRAEVLINRAARLLRDDGTNPYGLAWLLDWYNEGVRTAVALRPNLHTHVKTLTLASGTHQQLSGDDIWLHKVMYNLVNDKPGPAVRGPVGPEQMDTVSPEWHAELPDPDDIIYEYVWTRAKPRDFWVYPQATTRTKVVALISALPAYVVDPATEDHPLPGTADAAIVSWILFRAFSGDDERSPNFNKSVRHENSFYQALGLRKQVEAEDRPEHTEYGDPDA